jgi:hypothetical protein
MARISRAITAVGAVGSDFWRRPLEDRPLVFQGRQPLRLSKIGNDRLEAYLPGKARRCLPLLSF